MHGQITHEVRVTYRSRCFCDWKSDEYDNEVEANLAYDEHIDPIRKAHAERKAEKVGWS